MRIGVDLGGTKLEGILLDRDRQTRARWRQATPTQEGYDGIVAAVVDLVGRLEQEAGRVCTVGVGTPGITVGRTGLLKNANTTCLNGQPVGRDLGAALKREIRIDNDANCFAASEAIDGAAKGVSPVFGVILGTGVGGGIVWRDRVHVGPNGLAGEWGHTILEPDGPPCYCGARGCVETFLSGPGWIGDYAKHGGTPAATPGEIVQRAQAGEPPAVSAVSRYIHRFGRAVATLVAILDPEVIVLGGGLSNIDVLYGDGPAAVRRYVFGGDFDTPILRNVHGDSGGVRGAAMLWPPE